MLENMRSWTCVYIFREPAINRDFCLFAIFYLNSLVFFPQHQLRRLLPSVFRFSWEKGLPISGHKPKIHIAVSRLKDHGPSFILDHGASELFVSIFTPQDLSGFLADWVHVVAAAAAAAGAACWIEKSKLIIFSLAGSSFIHSSTKKRFEFLPANNSLF